MSNGIYVLDSNAWEVRSMKASQFRFFSIKISFLSPTIILLTVLSALGQTSSPCAEDFAKYCSDVTPGGGRLVQCYEAKKASMSEACKDWAERAKASANVVKGACATEIDARCNSERGDPFGMLNCLQSNYVSLSTECRVKLNEFKSWYPKPVK